MKKLAKQDIEDLLALTPMQEGMLLHYLRDDESDHYFEQLCLEIHGKINPGLFEKAWNFVVVTNEMLRTAFRWGKADKPIQIIFKKQHLQPKYYNFSTGDAHQKKKRLGEIKARDRKEKFDLHLVPFRVTLCKMGDDKYEMIISNHHILYDGWSNAIILRELLTAYNDLYRDITPLKPAKTPFKEYIKWLGNLDKREQEKYWQRYLKGFDSRRELSIKAKRGKGFFNKNESGEGTNGYHRAQPIGKCPIRSFEGSKTRLEDFCKRHNITLASLLYSAWGILLQRYNNSSDVLFGTTVSGRSAKVKGIEEIVGLFINTLPLRVQDRQGLKIEELLQDINRTLQTREEHESTPLVDIKEYSQLGGTRELFDTLLTIENYPLDMRLGEISGNLDVKSYSMEERTHYDLSVSIVMFDDIDVDVVYDVELFDTGAIERLSGHFWQIVCGILEDPGRELAELEILSTGEKHRLLEEFNAAGSDYGQDKTLHRLFEEQVEQLPDNIALTFKEHALTYRQLNRQSNRLAALLREKGTTPGTIAALMAERSIEIFIGVLAVLKCGGAYLPLDPGYPSKRIQYMFEDSTVQLLLTQDHLSMDDGFTFTGTILELDYKNICSGYPGTGLNPAVEVSPQSPAYIIYTSGSTGRPKGVLVEHASVFNLIVSQQRRFNIDASERVLQFSSICFDASVEQIFIAFSSGSVLVPVDNETLLDNSIFEAFLLNRCITHLNAVPSFLAHLRLNRQEGYALRRIISGGDVCPPALANRLHCFCAFYNQYGPTETTVTSMVMKVEKVDENLPCVPIGKPVIGTTVYLLDKRKNLVPIGLVGELYIGGKGVARGYLNRPGLTSERFVASSYRESGRLYYSGDLARWLPDGNMEFLGRIDHQVKVRGFRIELAEIENHLLSHQGVTEAVVIDKIDAVGDKYLCAYIAAGNECSIPGLKKHLADQLPAYMVPSYFVTLDKLPLTAAGKINRNALPAPEQEGKWGIKTGYTAPRDEEEKKLVKIWADVLGIEKERIGIDNNFFDLGGHSLKVINMAAKIHKALNLEVPVKKIFDMPTIRELSNYIKEFSYPGENRFKPIEAAELKEYYRVSSAQKRLYILRQMQGGALNYNMYEAFQLEGELDKQMLEKGFKRLIDRHESLRTSFHIIHDEPVQVISDNVEFSIEYFALSARGSHFQPGKEPGIHEAVHEINKNFLRPFDISKAPLLRVGLIKVGKNSHVLMVSTHHIISDGISVNIFIKDFKALYRGEHLPTLKLHYRDYSEWQKRKREEEEIRRQEQYWLEEYGGEVPVVNIPCDHPRPPVQSFEGEKFHFTIRERGTKALKQCAREQEVTLFMLLMASYNLMLHKISGAEEIVVGTPAAGRRHADLDPIVGMFVNTLGIKTCIIREKSFRDLLEQVKRKTLEAFENQDYQFEDLVERILPNRDTSRNPLFDTMFILQNMNTSRIEIKGLKVTPYPYETHIAPFDLYLMAEEREDYLYFTVGYCTKLFRRQTIQRFSRYFEKILRQVVEEPGTGLAKIEILSPEERRQLLLEFNRTKAPYPGNKTLHEWFEQQVEKSPHSIAVVDPGQKSTDAAHAVTYKKINEKANRLAHLLRQKGVGPDIIVNIMMERSVNLVVGILGILKAGGAYLPINPEYPVNRILSMLEGSDSRYFLTDGKTSRHLPFTSLRRMNPGDVLPVVTDGRPQIKAFDGLPHPDRTLVDYRKYHDVIGIAPARYTVNIQATRGCPYRCAYCHKIWPKTHVMRSAENIFAEMRKCYDAGVKRFVFIDDIFNLDRQNSAKLFETIINHDFTVQLFFPNGLRGDILTPDFIDLMIEAGTVNIDLALETASPRLQKLIGKNLNLDKFRENVHYITRKHPQVVLEMELMIGFPTETEKEALETLELLKQFKWVHFPNLNILKIYPNTDMSKLAIENGISKELIEASSSLAFHELPETLPFSKRFVKEYQAQFMNDYFLSGERLIHVLKHQVKSLTEDELVQKYDSYLPIEIKRFHDILQCANISSEAFGPVEHVPMDRMAAPDFSEKIKAYFPSRRSAGNACRVLLIDLSQSFRSESRGALYDVGAEPLGLMYLATYLNEAYGPQVEVKILKSRIDFDDYAELEKAVFQFNPHLIGIRTLSFYRDFFHRTVSVLRHWGITIPIIAGGPYATSDFRQMLRDYNIDLAVLGEGELTAAQLVKEMIKNNNQLPGEEILKTIPGLAFMPGTGKTAAMEAEREVILLDHLSRHLEHFPAENPGAINQSGDLLYLISTSGSTGTPKNVMVEHRCLVNLINFQFYRTDIDFSRVLQFAPIGFDVSVQEIFSALLAGGTLYLINDHMKSNVPRLFDFIERNRVNILFLPPAFLKFVFSEPEYAREFPSPVQHIITAGEQLIVKEPLRRFLRERGVYLHNYYGPSETHVVTTLTLDPAGEIPYLPSIGKPVSNTGIYILDKENTLLPVGVTGELCIGGIQVGRGYLGDAALTSEKFVPNPFVKGERLYRTGDIARWLPHGNIEFLGRVDYQVKIRGFRIEPGEIENQLLKHPDIKDAVVVTMEDKRAALYLAAYYVPHSKLQVPGLREFLLNVLPDYMIPSRFIKIDEIPLTSNGKLDRKSLPEPGSFETGKEYVPPGNEIEKKLVQIWEEVLDTVPIGIYDNFFDLGGHSLKATVVVNRIQKVFAVTLTIQDLFQFPTITGLAHLIQKSMVTHVVEFRKLPEQSFYELSYSQKRLWYICKQQSHASLFNMPAVVTLYEAVDQAIIVNILHRWLARYEILRASFKEVNKEPVMVIEPLSQVTLNFETLDWSGLVEKERESRRKHLLIGESSHLFNLEEAPLFRARLIKYSAREYDFLLNMHHIISDGWSMEILREEFYQMYDAYKRGMSCDLEPVSLRYRDFAAWQNRLLRDKQAVKRAREFWKGYLKGEPPVLNLPYELNNTVGSRESAAFRCVIKQELMNRLREIARVHRATLFMVLLAAFNCLLARVCGQDDVLVAIPAAGRQHESLENVFGLFVNTLILRTTVNTTETFTDFFREFQDNFFQVLEYQSFPMELICAELKIQYPDVNVFFNMTNTPNTPRHTLADLDSYHTETVQDAKFDIVFYLAEYTNGIEINCNYFKERFRPETIEMLTQSFINVLATIPDDPGRKLGEYSLTGKRKPRQLKLKSQAAQRPII